MMSNTEKEESTLGVVSEAPQELTAQQILREMITKEFMPPVFRAIADIASQVEELTCELQRLKGFVEKLSPENPMKNYNDIKVSEGTVDKPLENEGLGKQMNISKEDKYQILGILVAVMSLAVTVLIWVDAVRYDGLSDKLDAANSKAEASQQSSESRYSEILTEIRASNQRLDDMKDYVNAKTEKR